MRHRAPVVLALALFVTGLAAAAARSEDARRTPLRRAIDLDVGEATTVTLADGERVAVRLVDLEETRDDLRDAVREAVVTVEVDGRRVRLVAATYRLPVTVSGVRIDCPITKGYTANSRSNVWSLEKDARLRLWPAASPAIAPDSFRYPVRQRWFASDTQMANDPCYVDAGEVPGTPRIYYHYGLDFGGAEGLVEVVAATDGLVVSRAGETLAGHEDTPVAPRYDVVYLLDGRGWYYRYSHLQTIDAGVRLGERVRAGQTIGLVGKEGGSGGWTHLHFDINARQPNGKWGIEEGYVFIWEAYLRERSPRLLAVARPHHVARVGQKVVLDATRSWSASGGKLRFDWTLTGGGHASGAVVERIYERPGQYSEIVRVTDARGETGYDFAVVQVFDRARPRPPETIHATFHPTEGVRAGDIVTFKVRSFGSVSGETIDFGDGSPARHVVSDGNATMHAPGGYAVTTHRYGSPGDYVVTATRTGADGAVAVARLWVRVGRGR